MNAGCSPPRGGIIPSGAAVKNFEEGRLGHPPTSITQAQAEKLFGGASRVYDAVGSMSNQIHPVVVSDIRAHPGKYVFAALEVASDLTPVPEAYATAKAVADVVVSAADLAWELAH
jgi:hypothetical protein